MKSIVYATDLHLTDKQPVNRVTPVLERSIKKLQSLLSIAENNGGNLLLGGDVFDVPCPSYTLLERVFECIGNSSANVYLVRGNHDLKFLNDFQETAVTLLNAAQFIKILDTTTYIDGFNVVPFPYSRNLPLVIDTKGPYAGKYLFAAEELPEKGKYDPILVVAHAPIVTKPVPYDHILYKDIYTDADYLLCGHIHEQFEGKIISPTSRKKFTTLLNPGCVMRLKRNEVNIKPQAVVIYSSAGSTYHKYVPITTEPVDFLEEVAPVVSFDTVKDEKKIDIDDVTAYINNSKYNDVVKKEALNLVKKQEASIHD